MKKLKEALQLLSDWGLPEKQQNERSALSLLALANVKKTTKWADATQISMSIAGSKDGQGKYPGIMQFINNNYAVVRTYKENSRESFRDETIKPFVQAGICEHNPEEPGLSPNSKNNHYRLTIEVLKVIRSYGSSDYKAELSEFKKVVGTLSDKYAKARNLLKVQLNFRTDRSFNLLRVLITNYRLQSLRISQLHLLTTVWWCTSVMPQTEEQKWTKRSWPN